MDSQSVRVRAVVHGRVQMVGFRAFVIRHACDAGLAGTVRNLDDGSLEAVLEGPRDSVERMLDLLRVGPSHARVKRVDVDDVPATAALPAMMVAR